MQIIHVFPHFCNHSHTRILEVFQLLSNTDKERNHNLEKENLILLTFICRGTDILKKCMRYLKILGARRVRKYHTEDPQALGTMMHSVVAQANCCPLFVHPHIYAPNFIFLTTSQHHIQ